MAGQTQRALYAQIDQELSWSESELPQAQRTKHVHSLHPYLGKFIPQLVEVFLDRYFDAANTIYDPFVGSGTTLVEACRFGAESIGSDISAFNCLLASVKTTRYRLDELELELRSALERATMAASGGQSERSQWLADWYAPRALEELLAYRSALDGVSEAHRAVGQIVLCRAARSARRTTHFDLDFPRFPVTGPYHCFKHKRICRPVEDAVRFLVRYTDDTIKRLRAFAAIRTDRAVHVLHADARTVELPIRPTGVITSPPYPGLIDYHEQHRYAYELLRLADRREEEIGAAAAGRARSATECYAAAMIAVFGNLGRQMPPSSRVLIVVNDSRDLYPGILRGAGLSLEDRITRHVNRRTGRRAGEFFEDVLVCRTS